MATDSIWVGYTQAQESFTKTNQELSVVSQFSLGLDEAEYMDWGPDDCIWNAGENAAGRKIAPSAESIASFVSSDMSEGYDFAVDSDKSIWARPSSDGEAKLVKRDHNCNRVASFATPHPSITGVDIGPNGSLWTSASEAKFPPCVHKMNRQGSVIESWAALDSHKYDIEVDSDECVYLFATTSMAKFTTDGSKIWQRSNDFSNARNTLTFHETGGGAASIAPTADTVSLTEPGSAVVAAAVTVTVTADTLTTQEPAAGVSGAPVTISTPVDTLSIQEPAPSVSATGASIVSASVDSLTLQEPAGSVSATGSTTVSPSADTISIQEPGASITTGGAVISAPTDTVSVIEPTASVSATGTATVSPTADTLSIQEPATSIQAAVIISGVADSVSIQEPKASVSLTAVTRRVSRVGRNATTIVLRTRAGTTLITRRYNRTELLSNPHNT